MSNTQVVPSHAFTEEEVKAALPTHLKSAVTPAMVKLLNDVATDPHEADYIRNNFVSYTGVLKDGKFKTEDYINAVMYVSYKLMEHSNEQAYAKTFPARYAQLIGQGKTKKDISSYVAAYNKNKLVNLILEQSLIPSWVLNQDLYQKAINTQAELMTTAASELVRTQAANSLLTHLAKPKDANIQINIGENESAGMKEMRNLLSDLAQRQRDAIADGSVRTIDVAAQRIRNDEE